MTSNHYLFESKTLFRNNYIQTILGSIDSGNMNLSERKLHKLIIDKNAKLVLLELPSINPEATVILLIHGMGGCSESSYMRRIARKLWIRGFTVFMMNQRGSGLSMGLSDRLWNGGSSEDLVIEIERPGDLAFLCSRIDGLQKPSLADAVKLLPRRHRGGTERTL